VNVTREAVADALFSLLQATKVGGNSPFVTTGQNPKIWSKVPPGAQPAMYLVDVGETVVQNQAYGLSKYLLHFEILLYVRADASPQAIPAVFLRTLRDAIDAQMQSTPPGERQTLGGVVYHAWIEGEVLVDGGILDQQCVVMIPVKVLTGI
jgi:hypothetical protein